MQWALLDSSSSSCFLFLFFYVLLLAYHHLLWWCVGGTIITSMPHKDTAVAPTKLVVSKTHVTTFAGAEPYVDVLAR